MTRIIEWLESPQGESWSRENHNSINGILVSIKDDIGYDGWQAVFTHWDYNGQNLASIDR